MDDNVERIIKDLRIIADAWRAWARAQVPDVYASRGLHFKYLSLDNTAAGYDDCAMQLLEQIKKYGSPMGCGHFSGAVVISDEGTAHCSECELIARTTHTRCDDCGEFAKADELEAREPWNGGARHRTGCGCAKRE